jgi:transcriptional regulator with XRE-family HTH domain
VEPADIASQEPEQAARSLLQRLSDRDDAASWVGRFVAELEELTEREELERVLTTWGLSKAELARIFGVSRQGVAKWLATGVPPDRRPALADLAAATDLLARYLKRERIPAVVRRPAERLEGSSLLDLARQGRTSEVLASVREFFDLRRAVS